MALSLLSTAEISWNLPGLVRKWSFKAVSLVQYGEEVKQAHTRSKYKENACEDSRKPGSGSRHGNDNCHGYGV